MTINFRRAVASEAKPLVGLYAESGRGKTRSALLLAKGFTGDMSKVGMIETESGRGEAYADDPDVGGYNVLSLREDFSPKSYGAAISAAEKAGMQCLIVDSASHEWEGVNGVLAMAAENQAAGKKGPLVWQKPKIDHAREFMLRLQQTPIPLVIVCMRAKFPMYEVTPAHVKKWEDAGRPGGKPPKVGDWARSWELEPKQAADILFEMFVHGWIDEEHRFHGTKYTIDALRQIFRDNQPIDIGTGERLAQWAAGVKSGSPRVATTTDVPAVLLALRAASLEGLKPFRAAWEKLPDATKDELRDEHFGPLKEAAMRVDREALEKQQATA
jgi:hypothetical protein